MSILQEIKKQSLMVRGLMFGMSVITTVSLVMMVWFNSFQRDLIALNDQNTQPATESSSFALLSQGLESLRAQVYGLLGISGGGDSSDGTKANSVQLLPIASDK